MNDRAVAPPPGFLLMEPPLSPSEPMDFLAPGERIRQPLYTAAEIAQRWRIESDPPELEVVSAAPEPAPAAATVYVRLANGERVTVGTHATKEDASFEARMLTLRMGRDGEWLPVGGRYIRPDAIVSVDVETLGV